MMYTNPKFRSTPYRKTPSRINSLAKALTSTVSEKSLSQAARKQIHEERTALTKGQWRVFKLTPLYKFSMNRVKIYSRSLSAYLQSQTNGESIEETVDAASIRPVNSLYLRQDNPCAVEIVLKQHTKGELKVVMRAMLSGVGLDRQSCPDQFVHYPVMLHTGPVGLLRLLQNWLTNEFDCCVSPLTLSPTDLTWLLCILSAPAPGDRSIKLEYCVPPRCFGFKSISLQVHPQDFHRLWSSIHDTEDEHIEIEEVDILTTCLEQHFYSLFRLNLSCFILDKVNTSMADVSSNGVIRIHHPDHVLPVLAHLADNCLLQLRV